MIVGVKKNASLKSSYILLSSLIGSEFWCRRQPIYLIFSHFSILLLPKCFASVALPRTPRGLTAPPQLGNVGESPTELRPHGPEPPRSASLYNTIDKILEKQTHYTIVLGDFSAKVGGQTNTSERTTGCFGLGLTHASDCIFPTL